MLKILLVVLVVAVAIYAVTRLLERRRAVRPRPRQMPPGPMGPDDDPNFLRDLERKRRRRQEDEPEAG